MRRVCALQQKPSRQVSILPEESSRATRSTMLPPDPSSFFLGRADGRRVQQHDVLIARICILSPILEASILDNMRGIPTHSPPQKPSRIRTAPWRPLSSRSDPVLPCSHADRAGLAHVRLTGRDRPSFRSYIAPVVKLNIPRLSAPRPVPDISDPLVRGLWGSTVNRRVRCCLDKMQQRPGQAKAAVVAKDAQQQLCFLIRNGPRQLIRANMM